MSTNRWREASWAHRRGERGVCLMKPAHIPFLLGLGGGGGGFPGSLTTELESLLLILFSEDDDYWRSGSQHLYRRLKRRLLSHQIHSEPWQTPAASFSLGEEAEEIKPSLSFLSRKHTVENKRFIMNEHEPGLKGHSSSALWFTRPLKKRPRDLTALRRKIFGSHVTWKDSYRN